MKFNSISGKEWRRKNFNEETVDFLKNNYSLSEIVSRLIVTRNIKIDEINLLLNPKLKNILPNPYILKDMDKSIERTITSIIENKKIGIFGDYDVDGATSTAILGNYFNLIGLNFSIYIPDRKT